MNLNSCQWHRGNELSQNIALPTCNQRYAHKINYKHLSWPLITYDWLEFICGGVSQHSGKWGVVWGRRREHVSTSVIFSGVGRRFINSILKICRRSAKGISRRTLRWLRNKKAVWAEALSPLLILSSSLILSHYNITTISDRSVRAFTFASVNRNDFTLSLFFLIQITHVMHKFCCWSIKNANFLRHFDDVTAINETCCCQENGSQLRSHFSQQCGLHFSLSSYSASQHIMWYKATVDKSGFRVDVIDVCNEY